MSQVVVVGGGFGGMAAALRACSKGHQVTLVDRCPRMGGRAQVFERAGFKYDAGPTLLTAPFLFEELFELFNESMQDHVKLVPLKPWYRFEFADGNHFDYGGTLEETLAEIHRISPADVEGYHRLLEQSRKLYEVGFTRLADRPFHSMSFMLLQIPELARLGAWRTVWQMVCRYIQSDYLRQAFSIQPLLVGGNPFDTTCIYGLIHFLERAHGVHFAMGGTGALVDALESLMVRQGIDIRLNTTVNSLVTEHKTITGVEVTTADGFMKTLAADWVISNVDPAHLYKKLLPPKSVKWSARFKSDKWRKSMGLFVLFFGTARQYQDVAHHTIWMGPRYEALLDDIFNKKVLADDFSIYLHRPTATDSSFAPAGGDSFYALVPVPNLQGNIDWSTVGPQLAERVIAALGQKTLPDLRQHIVDQFFMTPVDFEDRYLSPDGAGFSVSPVFSQSAWFRFHNRGEGPSNLFLVGAGTHPGAGLPGVVSSAKVVDRLLPNAEEHTPG
jgi:phytoene desaturase